MIRTRLVWFSVGFASASAAISQFVVRDVWIDRESLSSQLKNKFGYLDARVSNLESVIASKSSSSQDES